MRKRRMHSRGVISLTFSLLICLCGIRRLPDPSSGCEFDMIFRESREEEKRDRMETHNLNVPALLRVDVYDIDVFRVCLRPF